MYLYSFLWQIPGIFGNMLRARHLAPRMKRAGINFCAMEGCRFLSIENLEVGDNVNIGFDNFIQARNGLTIGCNVSTAPGVKICSSDYSYGTLPTNGSPLSERPIEIGDNVFIGSNAVIMAGTILPEGCIVAAGAVVDAKPYRPFSILAGNPARAIGTRGAK